MNTQSAESTAAAAAAGLLPPMNIQSLAALAAMTQPSMPAATTAQPSAPLTNAATLLCKYTCTFTYTIHDMTSDKRLNIIYNESKLNLNSNAHVNAYTCTHLLYNGKIFEKKRIEMKRKESKKKKVVYTHTFIYILHTRKMNCTKS